MKQFTAKNRLFTQVAAAVAVVALCSSAAQGAILHDLISGSGSIVYGNLVFDQFSYISNNEMPDAKLITVQGTTEAGAGGLLFQGSFFDSPGGGSSSAVIAFRVTSLGGGINAVGMTGNPQVIGGAGVMSVTDTYLPETKATTLNIYSFVPGTFDLTDNKPLNGSYQSLHVQKGILAASSGGIAQMTFVTQTFSIVPEPASMAMAAIGLVGVGLIVRKRRK